MSDDPSTRNRRITKPNFRFCSTHQSRSQAPFYLYALRTIANRAEGTFGLLRYLLGGDLPSQTAHLARSLTRIHGNEVRSQARQGWYFTDDSFGSSDPQYKRLPAMLHMTYLTPIQGYSKGSRGLSV